MGPIKQVLDAFHGVLSQLNARLVLFLLTFHKLLVPDLPVNLVPSAYKGDTIYAGHHSLLYRLTFDMTL